jgi:hypothetical protein
MRTTLSIDDDVMAAARAIAERENKTVGEIVSTLARKALRPSQPGRRTRNGIPLLPTRGSPKTVTLDVVNRLRDDPM